MCVKWWTVKCGVLPVLATEQPPYYITQSSCLVEHIIRLCHQLQQNVCIRSTAVLCHAETLKWWRASCGRKYHEPEYFFHCPRAKNPPKQIYPQPQLWMILCAFFSLLSLLLLVLCCLSKRSEIWVLLDCGASDIWFLQSQKNRLEIQQLSLSVSDAAFLLYVCCVLSPSC